MTSTPSSTESSWIDVTSEVSESPMPASGPSFASVRQIGLKSVRDQQQQQLQLLLDAQRSEEYEDDMTALQYSDPGSPVSPASATFETSSCSLMEAAAVLLTSQRAKQQQDLMERSRQISSDWLWDWTVGSGCGGSGSGQSGCDWRSQLLMASSSPANQQKKQLSLRQWVVRHGLFSKQILSLFLLSNLVSVLLGGGIVYSFLARRSSV